MSGRLQPALPPRSPHHGLYLGEPYLGEDPTSGAYLGGPYLGPTSWGNWILVLAPFSSSSFTPPTSPAFTAKNRTCRGTRHRLGSAPRRSRRLMVSHLFLCLEGSARPGHRLQQRHSCGRDSTPAVTGAPQCRALEGPEPQGPAVSRPQAPSQGPVQPVRRQTILSGPVGQAQVQLWPCLASALGVTPHRGHLLGWL